MATGEVKRTLTGHTSYVRSLVINENNDDLISGDATGPILIWNQI